MGGSAFTDPNNPAASLLTPRMPAPVYLHVRDRALRILRTLYTQAECPIEAPAKADFGDVDILVASPHNQANMDTALLAAALGATQYKKNCPTTNFALPWPTAEELTGALPILILLGSHSTSSSTYTSALRQNASNGSSSTKPTATSGTYLAV
jgi:hypothetical protein